MPSRRAFLASSAAALACRPHGPATATPAPTPTAAPTPAPRDETAIDEATLAAAERIAGVRYDDRERAAVLAVIGAQLERAIRRRAATLPESLAPATIFDPRVPGSPRGPARESVAVRFDDVPLPADDEAIAFAPIATLGGWLRRGRITAVRLAELSLSRLREHGAALQCVARTTDALALEQARAADRLLARGRPLGPLHGIPWGCKDIIDTAGIATSWGAEPFADRVPERDATVVERLAAAGAVLCAKLSTGALAYGDIWDGGVTRNPWNPNEGSSGSSAGPAAATAAGLVSFALGSETLGSIVSPSMRCGTVGLRPSFGRVPRGGAMPLCWSLDKLGPLTRSVQDAMWVLAAIHGADDRDPCARTVPLAFDASADASGMRIGFVPQWFPAPGEPLERAALDALRRRGATLVELSPPTLPDAMPWDALLTPLLVEAAAAFEALTLSNRDDALTWQGLQAWPNTFRAARFITAIDLVNADRVRRAAMQQLHAWFEPVDAVVGPSFAEPMLLATNATGHPCLVVRTGLRTRAPEPGTDGTPPADATPRPCPHGVTLWGKLWDEGRLARAGMAIEAELGTASLRPPRP
ncbi:MAG: amidase [Nannocystaceae bacterium]|nr:amidase [Nannocystaceae bacterium]